MRFWDVTGAEVEAADAEAWNMPLAVIMRPFSTRSIVRLYLAAVVLYGLSGLSGIGLAIAARSEATNSQGWLGFHLAACALALGIVVMLSTVSAPALRRGAPLIAGALLVVTPFLVMGGLGFAGPNLGIVVLAYVQAPLFAFYMLRPRWALVQAGLVVGTFGCLLIAQDGWAAPLWTWLFLAGNVIGTGVVVGQIAARSDELAISEHDAKVELAELNHDLELRVAGQVAEIEHLSALRRFLSTQVADVVLADDSHELSSPHRARIAVFFCDLRGFTAFTNNAEPEEVLGVLDEYYGAVGALLQRYDATVGDYAGDGIMAYFGDPVPLEDPAMAAVAMTREVGGVMAAVAAEWRRRGYDLDYGVGLAYGYATLGVVGFDGRHDYKPVGGVVNLAARLCGKAAAGQVLLDHATYVATSERFSSTRVADLDLKGYAGTTPAYALDTT